NDDARGTRIDSRRDGRLGALGRADATGRAPAGTDADPARSRSRRRRRRAGRRDRAGAAPPPDAEDGDPVPARGRGAPAPHGTAAGRRPMSASIPRTDADLTPDWFSAALDRRVDSLTIEPVGVGVGLVGNLYRVRLTGDGDRPATMIAKLAAPTDEGRFVA